MCCGWCGKICCCCRSSSNDERDRKRCEVSVLPCIARVFSRRPFLVLCVTLIVSTVLSKLAVSQFGFPEFEDPYLGFESRWTPISNRLITLENLRKDVNKLMQLENYPGEKLSGREFRKRRSPQVESEGDSYDIVEDVNDDFAYDENFSIGGHCTKTPLEEYSRIALEIEVPKDVFSHEVLMLICYFQKLTEVLPEYNHVCEHDDERNCCHMWSLPNYVAEYNNKTDCSSVKDYDVSLFKDGLSLCRFVYRDASKFEACERKHEECPRICHRDSPIYSAMFLTLDKGFSVDEIIRYSVIIFPIPKSGGTRSRTVALQNALRKIQLPENGVILAGYDFGDKDLIFKRHLVDDLQYVFIGSIVVFLIVMFYTKSFSVTLVSFLVLVLSLGLSYFLYNAVFQIPYFPFMNMLVAIIVMGIGTDATLILGAEWRRLKVIHKDRNQGVFDKMMLSLLRETTSPLIVTTCTTAGAFFASLTSSITTIKCFSIFAGTSIIVGFLLIYLCVPTVLLLSDLCFEYLISLFSDPNTSNSASSTTTGANTLSTKIIKVFSSMQSVSDKVKVPKKFESTLRKQSTLLWTAAFLSLVSVLVWSCLIVFHYPGYQLPNSEQFQLLSSDHPIERYDREIEPRFSGFLIATDEGPVVDTEAKLTLYFLWGVLPVDTGYVLDPNDNGVLQFDPDFSLASPKNQKWMRKLCRKLKKQSFYDEVLNTVLGAHYDSCFIDTMVSWMKRDCTHAFNKEETYDPCCQSSGKFPYNAEVFATCVAEAAKNVYRTPSQYFQPDIAGPKFFLLRDNGTLEANSTEAKRSGHLATFALRVRTNVSYSLSYEKMKSFYDDVERFFEEEVKAKVPPGLENGFFISSHLDFFDLQNSLLHDTWKSVLISAGLCFGFIWVFSRSFVIAVGGVLCIVAIVIVSSAILISGFNWRLGVFESIAVTVAVGLSDFTAHHSLEYSRRKSVLKMISPTFFSATTTITIGLSMFLFSSVLVYQQIGIFFTVLVIVSWVYSVFFLSPILDVFDKIRDLCTSVCRLYFVDGFSSGRHFTQTTGPSSFRGSRGHLQSTVNLSNDIVEVEPSGDNVSAVIFSNPTASDDISRRNSCDDLEDPVKIRRLELGSASYPSLAKAKSSPNIPNAGRDDPSAILEKVKLLKKVAAETSV